MLILGLGLLTLELLILGLLIGVALLREPAEMRVGIGVVGVGVLSLLYLLSGILILREF